eukprot:m.16690 g.16690  ORF g.16690 m.16690 type:complete len:155 (+) comp9095_c1_seq1:83-547(+)
MLSRAGVVARTSIRGSWQTAGVIRGMKKKGAVVKKKKGASMVEEDDGSAASVKKMMIPLSARPTPELTQEDLNKRAIAVKQWSRHAMRQEHEWGQAMARVARVRSLALDELHAVNPELYYASLVPDRTLWPLHFPAPTDTPPIEDYTTTEAVKI